MSRSSSAPGRPTTPSTSGTRKTSGARRPWPTWWRPRWAPTKAPSPSTRRFPPSPGPGYRKRCAARTAPPARSGLPSAPGPIPSNVRVEDHYGNSISNVPVTFTVGDMDVPACDPAPSGEIENAAVFLAALDESGRFDGLPRHHPHPGRVRRAVGLRRHLDQRRLCRRHPGQSGGDRLLGPRRRGRPRSADLPVQVFRHRQRPAASAAARGAGRSTPSGRTVNREGQILDAARAGHAAPLPLGFELFYAIPEYESRERPVLHLPRTPEPLLGPRQRPGRPVERHGRRHGQRHGFGRNGQLPDPAHHRPHPGRQRGGGHRLRAADRAAFRSAKRPGQLGFRPGHHPCGEDGRPGHGAPGPDHRRLARPAPLDRLRAYRRAGGPGLRGRAGRLHGEPAARSTSSKRGEPYGTVVGSARSGAAPPASSAVSPSTSRKIYEAELVLNRGGAMEILSDRFRLPVREQLFAYADTSAFVSQDIDLLNERLCPSADSFDFEITRTRPDHPDRAQDRSSGDRPLAGPRSAPGPRAQSPPGARPPWHPDHSGRRRRRPGRAAARDLPLRAQTGVSDVDGSSRP